jgi:hypothetical protein
LWVDVMKSTPFDMSMQRARVPKMKLRRIARFLKERLQLLTGRVPSCRWVRLRLGAYQHWDPSLSRVQFGAIEKHLNECPECRAEWERTSELCHDLERLRRRMAGEPSIDLQVARLMVRNNENEAKQTSPRRAKAAWFNHYSFRLAALCLFIMAIPLFSYMGHYLVTEYFRPTQTVTEGRSLIFTLKNSAKASLPIELMVAISLFMIALPLFGYIAYLVFRPRQSPTQAEYSPLPLKRSAKASVPSEEEERPIAKTKGREG